MQHKLIMTWDITQGKEQEYFDFLIHTFVPRMNQLGFDLTDAWATIYGDCPQVLVTGFGASGISLLGFLPIRDAREFASAASNARILVKKAFDENGIVIPYQTITISNHDAGEDIRVYTSKDS